MKGKLDVTTYPALLHGGKTGAALIAGDAAKSLLIKQVSGPEPEMPEKGEKLSSAELAMLTRWVQQGAKDDSPAVAASSADSIKPQYPALYTIAPVISALAISPDGALLAVSGDHEILLHHADGSGVIARLPCASAHVTSICFTPDGLRLLAAGGSAGEFGRLDIYKVADRSLEKSLPLSTDTLFGLSVSPKGDRIAIGCADRTTRVLSLPDGKELDRFAQHTDWAMATCFNLAGDRIVSGGRDKTLWILDLTTHRPFDLVNDPTDPVLCVTREPKSDIVATGMANGSVRLYRLTDLVKTTERDRDPNKVREVDRMTGTVNAVAFSADGKYLAAAGSADVRTYVVQAKRRLAVCSGQRGAVFAVAFSPDAKRIYAGGFDGQVRIYRTEKGELIKAFNPFPMKE